MANTYKILLVDDEEDIVDLLEYNLAKEGFDIYTASNGADAVKTAQEVKPHLILMDVMMPKMDGIEACEEIRKIEALNHTIIAFLTARGEDYSQIAGYEVGADDYITKPIKPKVLISKVKGLLRRSGNATQAPEQVLSIDGLTIDREKYVVIKDEQEIVLPKKEFELLALLMSKPENVFTREAIFSGVWGHDIIVGDRTIDVHIRKLREKIGDNYIKTVKGVGYKFATKK